MGPARAAPNPNPVTLTLTSCARRLNELLLCCGVAMTAACSATAIASLFVEPDS